MTSSLRRFIVCTLSICSFATTLIGIVATTAATVSAATAPSTITKTNARTSDTCPSSMFFSARLECVLTYPDCFSDILNYILIVIVLIPFIVDTFFVQQKKNSSSSSRSWFWLPFFIGMFVFQICLCFLMMCRGVSIVWNALVGLQLVMILYPSQQHTPNNIKSSHHNQHCVNGVPAAHEMKTPLLVSSDAPISATSSCKLTVLSTLIAICFAMLANVYYMLVEDAITTVAHVCAVFVGVGAGLIRRSFLRHDRYKTYLCKFCW